MDTLSLPPHGVRSTHDVRHHVSKRRWAVSPQRRRGPPRSPPVRDAFETWHVRTRGVRSGARLLTVGVTTLAVADLLVDNSLLREGCWIVAVLIAGVASLLAVAAAERAGLDQTRRWHLQAVASAVVMFMLMANGTYGANGDVLWFLIVVGAASTLIAKATSYRESAVCLALDSSIVGFTTALMTIVL